MSDFIINLNWSLKDCDNICKVNLSYIRLTKELDASELIPDFKSFDMLQLVNCHPWHLSDVRLNLVTLFGSFRYHIYRRKWVHILHLLCVLFWLIKLGYFLLSFNFGFIFNNDKQLSILSDSSILKRHKSIYFLSFVEKFELLASFLLKLEFPGQPLGSLVPNVLNISQFMDCYAVNELWVFNITLTFILKNNCDGNDVQSLFFFWFTWWCPSLTVYPWWAYAQIWLP